MEINVLDVLCDGSEFATQKQITRNQIETGAVHSTNAPIAAVAGLQTRCGHGGEIGACT